MDPVLAQDHVRSPCGLQPRARCAWTDDKDKVPDLPVLLVQRGLRARLASQSIVPARRRSTRPCRTRRTRCWAAPAPTETRPGRPLRRPDRPGRQPAAARHVADMRHDPGPGERRWRRFRRHSTAPRALLAAPPAAGADRRRVAQDAAPVATEAIRQVQGSTQATLEIDHPAGRQLPADTTGGPPDCKHPVRRPPSVGRPPSWRSTGWPTWRHPAPPCAATSTATPKDLSQAARSLRSLSEQLEERPNAIIFGNPRQSTALKRWAAWPLHAALAGLLCGLRLGAAADAADAAAGGLAAAAAAAPRRTPGACWP